MPFEDKSSKKHTNDATSVRGQMSTPVSKVSQPTLAEPLEDQVQSVPLSQIEGDFYQLSEDEILRMPALEAKPLFAAEAYKIKPKDKHFAFYWGEYKAKNGLRYAQLKALGFENASEDDLVPGGHQAVVDGGKLILGDVILMKIPRLRYMQHLKSNLMKSSGMLTPQKIHEEAKRRAGTIVTGSKGMPSMERHKGEVFIPNQADVRDVAVSANAVEQRVFEEVTASD